MARPKKWPPSITYHKTSGQDRARINGVDHYLGPHGAPEVQERYARLLAEHAAGQLRPARTPSLTVEVGVALWLAGPGARLTPLNRKNYRLALPALTDLYGSAELASIGAREFKAVLHAMPGRGWSRDYANGHFLRLRTIWRWFQSEGMVPRGTWEDLRSVPCLTVDEATVYDPVPPVPELAFRATMEALDTLTRSLCELQLWTGARPGEILWLRPETIHRGPTREFVQGLPTDLHGCWTAQLAQHKTRRKGIDRHLFFGPRAQEILLPFLARPTEMLWPYSEVTYRKRVALACERAGVPGWSPNQLRHASASFLLREFVRSGLMHEAAISLVRLVLGHGSIKTSLVYAPGELSAATKMIAQTG